MEVLPELVRLGVASLKIEGRLKSPEYVASITRIYRNALDQIAAQGGSDSPRRRGTVLKWRWHFHAGFIPAGLAGPTTSNWCTADSERRGVFLGEITAVHRDGVTAALQGPLKPGDGLSLTRASRTSRGRGRVYEIQPAREGRGRRLTFGRGDVNLGRCTSETDFGKRAIPSWSAGCARVSRAMRRDISGL